jgi:hypothetical protein
MNVYIERRKQTLKQYLLVFINYMQDHWVYWLTIAKFSYNNSIHTSQSITPVYAE